MPNSFTESIARRFLRRVFVVESFLDELLADLVVYPFTQQSAMLAGKLDGEQQNRGVVIPFADLLIGATALSLGFSVLTANVRHFRLIPGLSVVQL